jgi:hypothetical protein
MYCTVIERWLDGGPHEWLDEWLSVSNVDALYGWMNV